MSCSVLESIAPAPSCPPSRGLRRAAGVLLFYALLYLALFSPVLLTGRLLAPGDGYMYSYAMYHAPRTAWTPNLFAGYPLSADPQAMSFYPPARLLSMLPSAWDPLTWNLLVLGGYILASAFTCALVIQITASLFAGLAAGIVYGMSGYMLAHLGHTNLIQTAAWLPLMLLAALRLRERLTARWFIIGCLAIAMSFLAGHAQITVYSLGLLGCYVLVLLWRAPAGRWRYGVTCGFMVAGGIALSAVQLLPAMQLVGRSVRSAISYDVFTQASLPLLQLLTLIYPFLFGGRGQGGYVGPANFGETAGFIGILCLGLIGIALWRRWRDVQTRFFASAALAALLLVLGSNGPLLRFTFHLPGYNLFRLPPRHFLEWTMAASVLVGIGLTALEREPRRRRIAGLVAAAMLLFMAAAMGVIVLRRRELAGLFADRAMSGWTWIPWHNPAVGIPLLGALVSAAALWLLATPHIWRRAAFLLILAAGLAMPAMHYEWHVKPPTSAQLNMPFPLAHYRRLLAESHQRMVGVRGRLALPAEGPPDLTLPWGLPTSGGYNPLVLKRYQRLMNLTVDGVLDPGSFIDSDGSNRTLDLLATRFLMMRAQPQLMRQAGHIVAKDMLSLSFLGDGPPTNDWTASPGDCPADELTFVSAMGNSILVKENTPALRITLDTNDGRTFTFHLRAGRDTAEQAWDRPDVKPVIRHRKATVFSNLPADGYTQHFYLAHFTLPHVVRVRRITLHSLVPPGAALVVRYMTLQTAAGAVHPITPADTLRNASSRWTQVDQFEGVNVYENRRAMPRAWLATRAMQLPPGQVADSIRTGRLPDGSPFDPATTALLEKRFEPLNSTGTEPGGGKADVLELAPTHLAVRTDSPSEGFVVLADVNYPGWRATVDGQPAKIYQTDYLLRGVRVPAGRHIVRMSFWPIWLYVGAAISTATALLLLLLAIWTRRPAPHAPAH